MSEPSFLPFEKVEWAREFIDGMERPFCADDWVRGMQGLIDDENFVAMMDWYKEHSPEEDIRPAAVAWAHFWHEHGERIGGLPFDREASCTMYVFVDRWLEDHPNDRYSYGFYEEYFMEGRAPEVSATVTSGAA